MDVELAEQASAAGALDAALLADLLKGAARRIAALGAPAYERQIVEWAAQVSLAPALPFAARDSSGLRPPFPSRRGTRD